MGKANDNILLVQDEYADFLLIQALFSEESGQVDDYRVTKIELDGQPSRSLLQNVTFGNITVDKEGTEFQSIQYEYFLPSKAHFVQVQNKTKVVYDLSFINKGSNVLLDV